MVTRHQILALGLLLGSSLFLLSCGRKAPPVVPELKVPAAPGRLSALNRGNLVYLSWLKPSKNLSGKPLRDLMEFEIYRRQVHEEEEGSPASLLARVKAIMPENAKVSGDSFEYVDDGEGKGLIYERQYAYFIRAVNYQKEASPPSKEVTVRVYPSPVPPLGLTAIAGDGMVFLSWEPSQLRTDGQPLAKPPRYHLYRGRTPSSHDPKHINPEPILGQSYVDFGLANEVSYYYVARAADNEAPPWHESLDSNEVAAIPTDRTPPSRPRHLGFALGPEGVRLAWNANSESDLLGYFVYRSLYPRVGFVRLHDSPIPLITYVDRTIAPSTTYYYAVSAVDSSPRQNESGLSQEVKVEIP